MVVRLARENITEAQVTAFKDFTTSFDLATLEEGYLGETENRFDDIANGSSGSFTIDAEGPEVFRLINFIVERAQRRRDVNTSRVNATASYQFPDGRRPRLLTKDMKFDAIPISTGGRDAYVNAAFSYKAPVPRLIEV